MGKRNWEPREMRMLAEFLRDTYPGKRHMTRVRLGPLPANLVKPEHSPAELRMIGIWRRWADALVILPRKLVLIEAAIRPDPGYISKLMLYQRLLPDTPELAEFKNRPVETVLVYALEDPAVVALAKEQGITTIKYTPKWLPEYLRLLFPRERRAPLTPQKKNPGGG